METNFPYELHSQSGGGFVTFEVGESVALPLIALNTATLRGSSESQAIVLSFASHLVEIQGTGLNEIFDHLLGRLGAGNSPGAPRKMCRCQGLC
jgi:hypothetical protein